jgi:hypothetical protein
MIGGTRGNGRETVSWFFTRPRARLGQESAEAWHRPSMGSLSPSSRNHIHDVVEVRVEHEPTEPQLHERSVQEL